MNIPSVDLADFISGDSQKKQAFVSALGHAYETIGFVAVKNHGLSDELVEKLYSEVKNFFDLPESTKLNYETPEIGGQRGYTSFGKEHAKNHPVGDLKEFWQFGQTVEGDDPIRKFYPDNVFCNEMPNFNDTGVLAYKTLENSGKYLLRAIALHLGLDEFYFDAKIHNGNSILRPIHYAPILSEPENAVRSAAHEDINLITLLMGASAEGLQILTKNDEWVGVTAFPDQLICNVGDMLQRLTNNKLRSTTHRVVNPPREQWETPRYSIPFFLHPRADMPLDCLENCITAENPIQYEQITAGEYLTQRLIEIGLL